MYDWREVAWATDALWAALRARLRAAGFAAPDALSRDAPPSTIWTDPDLLIAQTCGLPYVAGAARAARLVAAPVYAVEGCAGATYRSALVRRRAPDAGGGAEPGYGAEPGHGAERGAGIAGRFAANGRDSLSGWVLPMSGAAAWRIDGVVWTGAHRASVRAVAQGRADFAAIDAVAWDLATRFEPAARKLEVFGWTAAAPATPFVTSAARDADERAALREALAAAIADAPDAARALRLTGVAPVADEDYDPVRRMAAALRG